MLRSTVKVFRPICAATAARVAPVSHVRTIVVRPPYNPDRECSVEFYDCPIDGACDCKHAYEREQDRKAQEEEERMRELEENAEMNRKCLMEICANAMRNEELAEYYRSPEYRRYHPKCICGDGMLKVIGGECRCNPFNYAD